MLKTLKSLARTARQVTLTGTRKLTHARTVSNMGVKIAVGDHLSPVVAEHILNGEYERAEVKGIRAHLEPTDVVLELGSGIGFISLVCAKSIGADRVFTFEANPGLEPFIRRNYDLNGLQPTLTMCILGESDGEADFYVEKDLWDSSMVRGSATARKVSVPVRSLNEAVHRIKPTFLIMDIEGGEYDVIRALDFATIRKVAFETHISIIGEEKVHFVEQKLRDHGFVIDPRFTHAQQLVATRP